MVDSVNRHVDPIVSAVNGKLVEWVSAGRSLPAWVEQWQAPGNDTDRLRVAQAIRDSGLLLPEAGHYLVAGRIKVLLLLGDIDKQYSNIWDRLNDLEHEEASDYW